MARSRNIKPSIMENEDLADLAPIVRLLFIYLWMLADREGRLEDRPKRIAGRALPYDRDADVDDLLNQLAVAGFITRYKVGDQSLIHITNFAKHQSPHVRETASELPGMEEGIIKEVSRHDLGSASPSPRSPDSLFLIPDSLLSGSDADASVVASKLPTCPQKAILSLYAELLPGLPQIRKWDGKRAENLRNRWVWVIQDLKDRGKPFDELAGLDFFRRMFDYISKSDFLMGRSTSFSCCLEWIVKDGNFTKIIEGNYENKEAA